MSRKYGLMFLNLLMDVKQINLCERCKINEAIVVHHKDHNSENNTLKNLEILCEECHKKDTAEYVSFLSTERWKKIRQLQRNK